MPWLVLRLLALKRRLLPDSKACSRRRIKAGVGFVSILLLISANPVLAQSTDQLNVDKILQMFADFAFSVAGVLTKGIVLMIDVLIPIMTYNDFVGNPVVKVGWAIVRDTVNMFFVVVLIIIAFGTIFGHKKFQWQQQVPRLLIMAVVINFSKTLAGIMIDFGQVIMLTFANALREIAAGNFIQLFGLNQIYSISRSSSALNNIKDSGALGAGSSFDYFAAGFMSVFLTLMVLGTLIIFVAILLFRVVMLWVLVIIAPLAWFVKGAGGIIQSKAYEEWWNEFKCMVGVGPVITFFLWLTLAVVGSGNAAANSGFDVSASSNNANFLSGLLELQNFLSFLIGMAMFIAGLKAATEFCSSAGVGGKFVGKAINQYAKRIPQITAGVVGRTGAAGAGLGLKATGKGVGLAARGLAGAGGVTAAGLRHMPGSAKASRAIGNIRQGVRGGAYGALERVGAATHFRPLERLGIRGKGRVRAQIGQERAAKVNEEKKKLDGMSRDTIAGLAKNYAKNPPTSRTGEAQAMAILDRAMTDKRLQEKLRVSGSLQQLWDRHGVRFQQDFSHNSAMMAQVTDFQKANADITGRTDLLKNYDDVKDLNAGALKDRKVQDELKKITSTVRGEDGRYLNAYEAIARGHLGKDMRSSLTGSSGERFDRMTADELMDADIAELVSTGSGEAQLRAVEAFLAGGDTGRVKDIVAQMANRYRTVRSNEERLAVTRNMNDVAGTLAASRKQKALKYLNRVRDTVENLTPPPAIPLKKGTSAQEYVSELKYASSKQHNNAVEGLVKQQESARRDLTYTQTQRETLIGERRGQIEQDLQDLHNQLAAAKLRVRRDLARAADGLLTRAQKAADNLQRVLADSNATDEEKVRARAEAETLRTQYLAARRKSKDASEREKAISNDESVKRLKVEITAKAEELNNFNPEEIAQVKELSERVSTLDAHVRELEQARQELTPSKDA